MGKLGGRTGAEIIFAVIESAVSFNQSNGAFGGILQSI